MFRSVAVATLLVAAPIVQAPAIAQAPTAITAPEPARLAEAQRLIETLMPPAERDAMIETIVRPMMANMREAMLNSPRFADDEAKNGKLVAIVDEFVAQELDHSIAETKASMPLMLDAMARAYARRFTLDELKTIVTFYQTPAGRSYARQSATIMSDPDVMESQRRLMDKAMSRIEEKMVALAEKLQSEGQPAEN